MRESVVLAEGGEEYQAPFFSNDFDTKPCSQGDDRLARIAKRHPEVHAREHEIERFYLRQQTDETTTLVRKLTKPH